MLNNSFNATLQRTLSCAGCANYVTPYRSTNIRKSISSDFNNARREIRQLPRSTDIFGRYRSLGRHCNSIDKNMHDCYLASKCSEEKEQQNDMWVDQQKHINIFQLCKFYLLYLHNQIV